MLKASQQNYPTCCILEKDSDLKLMSTAARLHFLCEFKLAIRSTSEGAIHSLVEENCWHRTRHPGVPINMLKENVALFARIVSKSMLLAQKLCLFVNFTGAQVGDLFKEIGEYANSRLDNHSKVKDTFGEGT